MLTITDSKDSLEEFVTFLYESILQRSPDAAGLKNWVEALASGAKSPYELIEKFINSDERRAREHARHATERREAVDVTYHAPSILSTSQALPKRVALLGSCLLDSWSRIFSRYCEVDHVQLNHIPKLPERPPHDPDAYDFQIVQLPLRAVLPDRSYFSLKFREPEQYVHLFEQACNRMYNMLEQNLLWNRSFSILSFVCNFFTPQQNPLGRLAPRYDLRNLVYFIEQLNMKLYERVASYGNTHILDLNQLSSTYGKKYHQDDVLAVSVHHGLASDFDFHQDRHRIEPVTLPSALHETRNDEFVESVWCEALAMFRTVRNHDAVKLVIMDLDDSLWRGVAAEGALDTFGTAVTEGWPVGVIEALNHIKNRGILLAIASKNDEARIRELWPKMTGGRITIEDFSVTKINWKPKVENIGEILREVNLLPKNVLFIDDNPVERASVAAAFPGIRTLGENPYRVRQTLLWAPELQVTTITEESGRRTEMIQAQVKRETDRTAMSREDFLRSLSLALSLSRIESVQHPRFTRALELLNKTNQFNTTGKRWSHDQVVALFADGGCFWTFEVEDIYSNYGLVGTVIVRDAHIAQWAMSCRVLGLEVETAAAREIALAIARTGAKAITAEVVDTEANFICRDLYKRCGFAFDGKNWIREIVPESWEPSPHVNVALLPAA